MRVWLGIILSCVLLFLSDRLFSSFGLDTNIRIFTTATSAIFIIALVPSLIAGKLYVKNRLLAILVPLPLLVSAFFGFLNAMGVAVPENITELISVLVQLSLWVLVIWAAFRLWKGAKMQDKILSVVLLLLVFGGVIAGSMTTPSTLVYFTVGIIGIGLTVYAGLRLYKLPDQK